ncbi:hypothetical protein [Rhizohabitans arisaemae]|uniref:hypothetical protein n=1 Tax=Rhizohabitans arisaemae TaxID=2720610 RepID=UPI0024B17C7A|nr:hypothetical protein [Rhizohabitans arisaemae]
MSEVVPLPSFGEVFFDARGQERVLRVTWHAGTLVLSLWRGEICSASFRMPLGDVERLLENLDAGLADALEAEQTYEDGQAYEDGQDERTEDGSTAVLGAVGASDHPEGERISTVGPNDVLVAGGMVSTGMYDRRPPSAGSEAPAPAYAGPDARPDPLSDPLPLGDGRHPLGDQRPEPRPDPLARTAAYDHGYENAYEPAAPAPAAHQGHPPAAPYEPVAHQGHPPAAPYEPVAHQGHPPAAPYEPAAHQGHPAAAPYEQNPHPGHQPAAGYDPAPSSWPPPYEVDPLNGPLPTAADPLGVTRTWEPETQGTPPPGAYQIPADPHAGPHADPLKTNAFDPRYLLPEDPQGGRGAQPPTYPAPGENAREQMVAGLAEHDRLVANLSGLGAPQAPPPAADSYQGRNPGPEYYNPGPGYPGEGYQAPGEAPYPGEGYSHEQVRPYVPQSEEQRVPPDGSGGVPFSTGERYQPSGDRGRYPEEDHRAW